MSYAEDHRQHMAYEINRQNKEWKALNRRMKHTAIDEAIILAGIVLAIEIILDLVKFTTR